jgi:hypothetical protein
VEFFAPWYGVYCTCYVHHVTCMIIHSLLPISICLFLK